MHTLTPNTLCVTPALDQMGDGSMPYTSLSLPIQEARIDWITATAKHDDRGVGLLQFATMQTTAERTAGNKLERWRFHGYEGFQSGRWRYGWGEHGAIAVASGEQAHLAARELAGLADHWTRVDYAVTVLDHDDAIHPDNDYWDEWAWKDNPIRSPATVTRIQQLAGDATFSIGNRESSYYLRVYNKHHESRGEYPKGSWRWELELKQHASEAHHARWRSEELRGKQIAAMIGREMERYQLTVPWPIEGDYKRAQRHVPKTDADRTLAWLRKQVLPSVQFALEARGVDAVLAALNLPRIIYEDQQPRSDELAG